MKSKKLFGVTFTTKQWAAIIQDPPRWDLNPPQREEYNDDHSYAIGEREYANRVLATIRKKK
jgi:hypothetical protein